MQETWTAVDRYLTEALVQPDAALDLAIQDSRAAGLPTHNVSAPQGKMLQILAQLQNARRILEIGTLGGYSAIWMARALTADGKLVTLEVKPEHAAVARANLVRAGVSPLVDILIGHAPDTLKKMANEGVELFDLIFIDADKPGNPVYFDYALKFSRPGSLIVVDNVIRNGEVIDSKSNSDAVQGIRRMNEMIAAEPRVSATTIQTVGMKGYDGFTLIRVTK